MECYKCVVSSYQNFLSTKFAPTICTKYSVVIIYNPQIIKPRGEKYVFYFSRAVKFLEITLTAKEHKMLYGGVEDSPNVSVEYQAADQILSFYVALYGRKLAV